jgi:hypothetical protein
VCECHGATGPTAIRLSVRESIFAAGSGRTIKILRSSRARIRNLLLGGAGIASAVNTTGAIPFPSALVGEGAEHCAQARYEPGEGERPSRSLSLAPPHPVLAVGSDHPLPQGERGREAPRERDCFFHLSPRAGERERRASALPLPCCRRARRDLLAAAMAVVVLAQDSEGGSASRREGGFP